METTVSRHWKMLGDLMQKAGRYLLIEIILPGGTLIALLLLLYRRGDLTALSTIVARGRVLLDRVADRMRMIVLVLLPDDLAAVIRADSGRERDGLEPLAMGPSS